MKEFAQKIKMGLVNQTKLITAASELARNMLRYADGGDITIEVVSKVYKEEQSDIKKRLPECRGINVPKHGELVSGDGFCLEATGEGFRILVADGLGHGADANAAVKKACEAFTACTEKSPTETIRYIHSQIRKTRGIVGLVVFYNNRTRSWKTTGVGNITARCSCSTME